MSVAPSPEDVRLAEAEADRRTLALALAELFMIRPGPGMADRIRAEGSRLSPELMAAMLRGSDS